MRTWRSDPQTFLVELADLQQEALPDELSTYREHLLGTVEWAKEFLCNPHSLLGRGGPVCPFVRLSMDKGLFWLTVCEGEDPTTEEVFNLIIKYRDWFLELEPQESREAQYKTILILFPNIRLEDAPRIIDTTQELLKPEFVSRGIMIGQFHMMSQEPGLWSDEFRPLQSPIPLLAIRYMVPTDFPFLRGDARYVASYLNLYQSNIPKKLQGMIDEAVTRFGLLAPESTAE